MILACRHRLGYPESMSLATASLPSDPDELRAFAAALQVEVHAKTLYIEKLKAELAALRRARFGRSSEKLDRTIEQLELAISELEENAAEDRGALGRCSSLRWDEASSPAGPGRHTPAAARAPAAGRG